MTEAAGRPEFFTSTVLYGGQSLARACAEIASLGLRAVDIWHVRGWCEHLAGGAPAVAAILRDHGLRLEAISAYNTPLADVRRLLPVLADLGGRVLVTGSTPPEVTVADFAERIRPLAREAASLGVRLGIENHGQATVDSIASMTELLERVPEEGLGIALAPIHLWVRGEETAEAVRRLRGRIALFYLWDWGPTAQRNWKDPSEQLVGTGRIPFGPIVGALREIRFPGPICVFAHGPEHWPPARTTQELRAALRRAHDLFAGAPRSDGHGPAA